LFVGYELTPEEAAELPDYWSRFKEGRGRPVVDAAVRRLSYAAERHRPDDRLVDLVIAAESLFLGGSDDPSERQELRYRYALRAAHYIEVPGRSRRAVYTFMRNTYDVRSAIVHGGQPRPGLLRDFDGSALSVTEFADATENLIRLALHKAVEHPQPGGPLVDWDKLILGDF
jgi:hypothetical protein